MWGWNLKLLYKNLRHVFVVVLASVDNDFLNGFRKKISYSS